MKLKSNILKILIPMAGAGSRFVNFGYEMPKPLIKVKGQPMFKIAAENVRPKQPHRFIFICQKKHLEHYNLKKEIMTFDSSSIVLEVNEVTDGAARTALIASDYINDNSGLMIANCDQYVDLDINEYLTEFRSSDLDGYIMTMTASDDRWSFVKLNEKGLVTEVREKEVISSEATVGIYNFKRGSDFVEGANHMIKKRITYNEEFYIAPVYNELIESNKKIGFFNIGSLNEKMHGLGTPSDLEKFLDKGN